DRAAADRRDRLAVHGGVRDDPAGGGRPGHRSRLHRGGPGLPGPFPAGLAGGLALAARGPAAGQRQRLSRNCRSCPATAREAKPEIWTWPCIAATTTGWATTRLAMMM